MTAGNAKKKKHILPLILLLLLVFIAGAAYLWYSGLNRAYTSKTEAVTVSVEIPEESTAGDIASILEKDGIIRSSRNFKWFSRLHGYDSKYRAGKFSLSSAMTAEEIAEALTDPQMTSFTVPEGYSIVQIAALLEENGLADANAFLALTKSPEIEKDYDFLQTDEPVMNPMEGFLFPDTYSVNSGVSEEDILRMMLDRFADVYQAELEKKGADPGKFSTREVVTVASMIEKEALADEERARMASVINNRLAKDMTLGMDSTVHYIFNDYSTLDLTMDQINSDSPYNTYRFPGLPPGPICSPGASSLAAVLHPENTKYLFYVLSTAHDGTHVFSETDEDFQKNVDAYYASLE